MSPVGSRSSRSGSEAPRRGPGRATGARPAGAAPRTVPELIYGRNPVREALRGRRQVHSVLLVVEGDMDGGDALEQTLEEWSREGRRKTPMVHRLSARELTARLQTIAHQGIAAEVDPFPYADADQVLARSTLLVALDEVQDPHNLGAVIRTAEAVGAGVLIPRHRAAEVTAAVVRASAGASEHALVAQVRNLSDFLATAKERGFWVYGAAAGADAEYSAQDYTYPTCFVLGSEGQGLGRRIASFCDVMVGLPLLGRVESLNVSVATGVLLYEALRQRKAVAPGTARGGKSRAAEGRP